MNEPRYWWIEVDGVQLCVNECYETRHAADKAAPPWDRRERFYVVHTLGDAVEHPVLDEAIRLWRDRRVRGLDSAAAARHIRGVT